MGIKLGQYQYRVQPVHKAVRVQDKPRKSTEERVLEVKNSKGTYIGRLR